MTQERWLLSVIATLVTDATWLYLLLAFLGFTAGIDGAPLAWPVVFGLPMLAALTHLLLQNRNESESKRWMIGSVLGIAVIYWAVAVGRIRDAAYAGFAWPVNFVSGSLDARDMYSSVILLLFAAYLWSRGRRRAAEPEPGSTLLRSFHTGLVVFMVVVFFEEMGDLDLGSRVMMLPFFGASLMGLAVSRSAGRFGPGASWLGFVAASVAAVLATGVIVAIVGSLVIRQSADILSAGWIAMMTAFVTEVRELIEGLKLDAPGGGSGEGRGGAGALTIDPPGAAGPDRSIVEIIVALLGPLVIIAGTAAFVWICRRLLAAPDRLWPKAILDLASVERESLGDQEAISMSQLFERVMPGWMLRSGPGRTTKTPALGAGIEEVYTLYFRLLDAARERDGKFSESQTPLERAPYVKAVLASAPVEDITSRFIAACYGREPTAEATVMSLSDQLEDAVRAANARDGQRWDQGGRT